MNPMATVCTTVGRSIRLSSAIFMKKNVYKVELLIIDHDNIGITEVRNVLENSHYPNRCIMPKVMNMQEREVEWSDEHPLNKRSTMNDVYKELFKPLSTKI